MVGPLGISISDGLATLGLDLLERLRRIVNGDVKGDMTRVALRVGSNAAGGASAGVD
jgi:hypothetical protein